MFKETESMKEIHLIRERHYEETKHMSSKEFIESVHCEAQKAIKKYGLKFEIKDKQDDPMMKEIHFSRAKMYEITKNMSAKGKVMFIKEKAGRFKK